MNAVSLLGLLPFLASAQAYFILSQNILTTTRLDPIVSPGGVSQHVHSIVGGSNFDKSMSYESARSSSCTTAPVSEDKSNYWTPQLYYYNPNDTTFQAIEAAGVNTYYLPRYGKDGQVQAFPDGLRMISGNPYRRTFNNDADSKAITFVCLDYSGSHQGDPEWAERNSFFNHNCPNGMRMQVFFRSCWDGVNLDSADHVSHMAWPSGGVDGGECPSTHPVRLVSLFYEFIYNVQNYPFNDLKYPTWVLANGDTTGYGFHGDFLNGWPSYNNGTNILQQAIDDCNQDNGVGGELKNCPPFVPYLQNGGCGPSNLLVNEDVGFGKKLSKLPGDNPIWIGDGKKPSTDGYIEPNTTYTDFKSIIPDGFTEVGCIAEGTSGRALLGKSWSSDNMTRGSCVQFCQDNGFPLAGVEFGRECYCDTVMRNGASNTTLLDSAQCNRKCAANSNEYCGGASTLSLFNNPSLYPQQNLPTGWSANGCYTEGTGSRALPSYAFSSDSMTQNMCISGCAAKGYSIAGVEWSRECYCSNAFAGGAKLASDSDCKMTCAGDVTRTCGGSQRLTTFVYSNSTSSVIPSASASASASANATSVAVSSSSSKAVSSSVSLSASASSSKAASSSVSASSLISSAASSTVSVASSSAVFSSSASVSASSSVSSSLSVANNIAVPSSASSPSSVRSSSASVSSASATSATSSTTSVSASASPSVSASASSSPSVSIVSSSTSASASATPSSVNGFPSGWTTQGCLTEATTGRALAAYSFSSQKMTPQLCVSTCSAKGYKYAGSEWSQECYCGDFFGVGVQPAADGDCNNKCKGDSTQICGGSSRLSLYVNQDLTPGTVPNDGWSANGCYTEATGVRALKAYSFTSGSMTPQLCMTTCEKKGYSISGVEYSTQCFCGNQFENGSIPADAGSCSMTCGGDAHQLCGGPSRLSTFTKNAAVPVNNKAVVASSSSAVASSSTVVVSSIASSSVAPSSSSAAASSAVVSSSSSVVPSSTSTVVVPSSTSTSSSVGPSSTTTSTSTTSTVVVTSTSSTAAAAATNTAYVGCFVDRGSPRQLNGTSVWQPSGYVMTNDLCMARCASQGFAYAGTEYNRECHCGNYLNLADQALESSCSYYCFGDKTTMCGGSYRLSLYATNNGTAIPYGQKPTRRSMRRSSRLTFGL